MELANVFDYQGYKVRTVVIDGAIWFVAKDVCDVLGISKYRDAVARLDEDEGRPVVVDTLGGNQEMAAVNESGLYSLILTSRKPEARAFKKWITSEVLPQIRATGIYGMTKLNAAEALLESVKLIVEHQKVLDRHEDQISDLGGRVEHLEGGKVPDGYMIVARYASKYRIKLDLAIASKIGRTASRLCRERGIEIHLISDGRFEAVGAYPETILKEAFASNGLWGRSK